MADIQYIQYDFVKVSYSVFDPQLSKKVKRRTTLYWGDKVERLSGGSETSIIRLLEFGNGSYKSQIPTKALGPNPQVIRFSMVDVQQGDGMILETPPDENDERKIILIDGGDNKLFARHVAARFRHRKSSKSNPLPIDLIMITHGDGDHFDGLNKIRQSESERGLSDRKRLFIHPERVYHNGLVKLPGKKIALDDQGNPIMETTSSGKTRPKKVSRPAVEMFGNMEERDGDPYAIDLVDDPRDFQHPPNKYFKTWYETLDAWEKRGAILFKRIAYGMNADELFGDFAPLKFEIQGPFTRRMRIGGRMIYGLKFLRAPKKNATLHEGQGDFGGYSASHTVNGHSISLRITYGNVRLNLTGDHNQESMALMRDHLDLSELESEIIKAPHHGSADFDYDILEAMRPVVSLVSSGDESAKKEHVHPRATLMAALGRVSRTKTSILLSTELTSFFAMRGYSHTREDLKAFYKDDRKDPTDQDISFTLKVLNKFFGNNRRSWEERKALPDIFAFERTNFGIIHIRTDGKRVLVFTHTGKELGHEAYAFTVSKAHRVKFEKDVRKL